MSMFEIVEAKIGRFTCHRLINKNTKEYLEVLSDFGGGINDLVVLNGGGQLVSIIDGYRTDTEIAQTHHTKFKGSKLSPFPNRVEGGQYVFEDKTYQLLINDVGGNTNLHAFLHNKPFEVTSITCGDSSAKIILSYSYKGEEQGYPFFYELKLTYQFGLQGARFTTRITNTDSREIPIGDGWHPYFHFDHDIDSLEMKFRPAKRIFSNMDNGLSDDHGFEDFQLVNQTCLDDCFEVNDGALDVFELELKDSTNQLLISLSQDSGIGQYKYFQIYTPPSRKQIALEPVTCPPFALNSGEGLILLGEKQTTEMAFEVNVSKF